MEDRSLELKNILSQYWGYSDFRGIQQDIISSVLDGNDCLAILPTGGGKSICYQLPSIYLGKTVLVISPLVALMKDQVDHLNSKGINSIAIHSGMSLREIDINLDNVVYGNIRLLYVAPERIRNELFIERLKKMDIGLVAIDEAHCTSQWGQDFRPAYLEIPLLRENLKDSVPFLALTASATPKVEKDMIRFLKLNDPNIFKRSAKRENLSLSCYKQENKLERLLMAVSNVKGSSLVYVRNRKKTKEISNELNKAGIKSTFFHAGLTTETKFQRQENWMSGKVQSMVCTNAFGMGIDKGDVRLVVHFDLPDSLESYYQEVGRAGRDGKLSYGLTIFDASDIKELIELNDVKYPDLKSVIGIYNALCNSFKLALGSGESQVFNFKIERIAHSFDLVPIEIIRALNVLEKLGLMQLIQSQNWTATLNFSLAPQEMYRFQVENPEHEPLIRSLLRLYGGELYSQYVSISEERLARISSASAEQVGNNLKELKKRRVLSYHPSSPGPKLLMQAGRISESSLKELYSRVIKVQKEAFGVRLEKAEAYYNSNKTCRMVQIQAYFGEKDTSSCGKCDHCLEEKKTKESKDPYKQEGKKILDILTKKGPTSMNDLMNTFSAFENERTSQTIRLMIDSGMIVLENGTLSLKKAGK